MNNKFSLKNTGKEIITSKSNRDNAMKHISVSVGTSPILLKDNINNSPGYGLWCIPSYDNNDYKKPNLCSYTDSDKHELNINYMVSDLDKKIIEQLKSQIKELIVKLELSEGKFYDSLLRVARAEELQKEYLGIARDKIKESSEINEYAKSLEGSISNFNECLANSKREISRLNKEINLERESYQNLRKEFEDFIKESKDKVEKYQYEIISLHENIRFRDQKYSENVFSDQGQNLSTDGKSNHLINLQKNISGSNSKNNLVVNKNLLLYQLEIVDLKKKISDDEVVKNKLLEIIKTKKEKIKLYKLEINKLTLITDDFNKEVRWKKNLVSQKDSMIQVLKNDLKKKSVEEIFFKKEINKLKKKKKTVDECVEAKYSEFSKVPAHPELFLTK